MEMDRKKKKKTTTTNNNNNNKKINKVTIELNLRS